MKFCRKLITFFGMIIICITTVSWVGTGPELKGENEHMVIDFNNPDEHENWRIVNDGVMGGLSQSEMIPGDTGIAIFKGTVSLDNNGGFASVRTQPRSYKLDGFSGLSVRVKGDGKKYHFRARTNDRYDGISYRYIFETKANEWMTIQLPFSDFIPVYRGRILDDVGPLSPELIQQLGFLIADKQKGKFHLEIKWINAYK
jgi:monofunctional biosynthetic peptidoglycan transglycosylase